METRGCFQVPKWLSHSLIVGAISMSFQAPAVGPQITKDNFPEYHPAHTVIKCPYIPPGLKDLPTCGGQPATCVGTEGHDLIIGSDQNDVIVAGNGNDVVHADAMDDIVCGGAGNDSLFGARGQDRLYGELGDDWLFGAVDPNVLDGGEGDFDVLWGGPSTDYLDGGSGSHDVCIMQRDIGDYDPQGCNTAIRANFVCFPAWFTAPSVETPKAQGGE